MTASAFVPVGVVAFAGSRHGSPFGVAAAASAVAALGLPVRVGCQRGVDAVVRSAIPAERLTVISVTDSAFAGLPMPRALAARTRVCVSGSSCLLAFVPASGILGHGTALAVSIALDCHLPVFVASPVCPAGSGWSASSFAGVAGFAFTPSQTALF